MKERWKAIKGYEGFYEISDRGRVKSFQRKKTIILKNQLNQYNRKHKVWCVSLNLDGIRKLKSIHRLVAEAFIPNPENKPQVNHKDGNSINEYYKNLEWCTGKENMEHAVKNNLMSYGDKSVLSKLKSKDILKIIEDKRPSSKIAKDYNVTPSLIQIIKNRKIWKRITKNKNIVKFTKCKLTEKEVIEIINSNLSESVLAKKFNISTGTISDVKNRRIWRQVTKDKVILKNPISKKLTSKEVLEIIKLDDSDGFLGKKYNVSPAVINDIRNRKTYCGITKYKKIIPSKYAYMRYTTARLDKNFKSRNK